MEVPDPKLKPPGVVENKGGVAVVDRPVVAQAPITTPDQIHQQTADKVAVSLSQADILPVDAQVKTNPPEQQTVPYTADIEHVGGQVLGAEELKTLGNWATDTLVYPVMPASNDLSKITITEAGKGDAIADIKAEQKKNTPLSKDDGDIGV